MNRLSKQSNDSLITESRIQVKPCHEIIGTGASLTIARPYIISQQPERKPSRPYILQMVSGETIPVLKEVLVELTLGQSALKIWVFITEITDELILELDVLRAYDTLLDLGHHVI